MRALSIRPPWVYAIFNLGKDIENRKVRHTYTGDVLIHSSKTWDRKGYIFITETLKLDCPPIEEHTFGRIEGLVAITKRVVVSESVWFMGEGYGYCLDKPREFKEKPFYRGQLGLFHIPDAVIRRLKIKGGR